MGLNAVSRIVILQKKALRIMNFQSRDSHSSPLFRSNNILKLEDKILIENILFITKSFNNFLPPTTQSHLLLIRYLNPRAGKAEEGGARGAMSPPTPQ